MEFESIKRIVEAEKEAEEIKFDAKQKAKTILEQAEKTKENSRSYFKKQLETKQKELEKEQAEKNLQTITKIKADTTEKLQQINKASQDKISKAVEQIFQKVVKL